jgi:hypothetical protein
MRRNQVISIPQCCAEHLDLVIGRATKIGCRLSDYMNVRGDANDFRGFARPLVPPRMSDAHWHSPMARRANCWQIPGVADFIAFSSFEPLRRGRWGHNVCGSV